MGFSIEIGLIQAANQGRGLGCDASVSLINPERLTIMEHQLDILYRDYSFPDISLVCR